MMHGQQIILIQLMLSTYFQVTIDATAASLDCCIFGVSSDNLYIGFLVCANLWPFRLLPASEAAKQLRFGLYENLFDTSFDSIFRIIVSMRRTFLPVEDN
jgi:hypothetical protein